MTTQTKNSAVKTIDVNALGWFDKVNGNSYFAGTITTDYGTPKAKEYIMPFQYGYGEQYVYEAKEVLQKAGVLDGSEPMAALWRICEEQGIILRHNIQKGCKKSELMAIGK